MKVVAFVIAMAVIAVMPIASAQSGHSDFSDVQQLIDNPVECDQLTDEQLERLGEYFMELRHPGEAHEVMDNMMGGEGSGSLKEAHIRMGEAFYCNSAGMGGGMMGFGAGMMNGYGGIMYGYRLVYVLAGTIIALLVIIILLLSRRK